MILPPAAARGGAGTLLYSTVPLVAFVAIKWLRYLMRRREGRCPYSNYDRAGLPAGAACPECGAAPAL